MGRRALALRSSLGALLGLLVERIQTRFLQVKNTALDALVDLIADLCRKGQNALHAPAPPVKLASK